MRYSNHKCACGNSRPNDCCTLMVFITGSQSQLAGLEHRTVLFLLLSGLATGAS